MKNKLRLVILFIPLFGLLQAQTATQIGVWLDHLPYSKVTDLVENDNKVYCATEQGLFIYDNLDKSIVRMSKVNGLNDVRLNCLAWSDKHQMVIIGYNNGNIDLVQGEEVTNVPDLRFSGNFTGLKSINEILVEGDTAYISTNFGAITYNLATNVVIETFVIGENGTVLAINDLAIGGDTVYAATSLGLMRAYKNSELSYFLNWKLDSAMTGSLNQVEFFADGPVVNRQFPNNKDEVWHRGSNGWEHVTSIEEGGNNEVRVSNGFLAVSNGGSSKSFDENFTQKHNFQAGVAESFEMFTTSAAVGESDENFWVATSNGLYYHWQSLFNFNELPNGPATKSVQQLFHDGNRLIVCPGGVSPVWSPTFNNDGYFELSDYFWTNRSNTYFGDYKDIVAVGVDPIDPSRFFLSSYGNGILEFKDTSLVQLHNKTSTNGAMASIAGTDEHRVGGFSADERGNIWFTNSKTDKPLGRIDADGTIQTFSLGSIVNSSDEIKNILHTTGEQVWIQVRNKGIAVINVANEPFEAVKLAAIEGEGDLPTERVLAFAEDEDGEIWIGTDEGLAVLYSPQNIFEPERNYDAQIIVIDEDGDGSGERVLGAEVINDIAIDGSNKKWFATENSGVYYTSENGKEQIYHFTTENSPLPSNVVFDIAIDDVTGMVYFATDQGIVSFQGGATEGVEEHTDVFAYPNPVEPGYTGPILIRGLVTNAQVKITDIEGNIVFETIAEGGQALWSGNGFDGKRVQSGVYLTFVTDDLGAATAATKIMIIN